MLGLVLGICGANLALLVIVAVNWASVGAVDAVLYPASAALAAGALALGGILAVRTKRATLEMARLKESELLHTALFENTPVCMNLKDPSGQYLMANPAYCEWYGKPQSEVIGQGSKEILAATARNAPEIERVERTVAVTGRAATIEVEVARQGKRYHRLLVKFPALDDRGVVIGLGTVAIDVTELKEAEAALSSERERAARLEAILREAIMAMPAAFAIFDESDKLVICNSEYAQFNPTFRNDPNLATGLSFRQIVTESVEVGLIADIDPGNAQAYIGERVRLHEEASGLPFEQRVGGRIFVTYETRMPQGGIILLRQDVTDQRQLERKHQETEDLLRNLFDNFGHGIMIRDRETRLVRANRAALEQIDRAEEEVIGRTTSEMFEILGVSGFTGDITLEEIEMMEARAGDDTVVSRNGPDGTPKHLRISRFPLIDRNDEVQGLGVLRYDVTELIESQRALQSAKEGLERTVLARTEELRISERRFRFLAQASADYFWECDRDLRFTYFSEDFPNPLGFPTSELIGMSIPDFYAQVEQDPEATEVLLSIYERREQLRDFEIARSYSDGTRYLRLSAIPRWENGVFDGYVGTTTDISELHEALQGLIESERLASLGSMVAGVAHEINTPIGVCVTAGSTVSSAAENLLDALDSGNLTRSTFDSSLSRIVEGMRLVDSNLARAAKLISSFKSIAVDQTSEEQRLFDLVEYLRNVIDSLSPQLERENVSVTISGPDDLSLFSYPGAIAQILTNLVMNSIIHGFADRDQGEVSVTVIRSRGSVKLVYADDGQGMSEETVKRVFDPFFTTKRGQGGSGLGMHILFNLVTQLLKGTVKCDSAPGRGVEISIRFPLIDSAP